MAERRDRPGYPRHRPHHQSETYNCFGFNTPSEALIAEIGGRSNPLISTALRSAPELWASPCTKAVGSIESGR
jgi:hypothetical protein